MKNNTLLFLLMIVVAFTASAQIELVSDINDKLSNVGSAPSRLTVLDEKLLFIAYDGITGSELWVSEGNGNTTELLTDINPGIFGAFQFSYSQNNGFVKMGNEIFFAADDGTNGIELWKTDGTAAGTQIVKDINPGTASSFPGYFVEMNGVLYFSAVEPVTGRELWRSDGTDAGTYLVADILTGISNSSAAYLTAINSRLYFAAYGGSSYGVELWTSDGTPTGTQMIKDIRPGANSGMSTATNSEFTLLNNEVFFVADDGINGNELWKTDGTNAGTVLVADIANGSNYSLPEKLVVMNGILYFRAQTPQKGYELYRSDGTTAGTYMVKEINVGPYGIFDSNSSPEIILVADTVLYFQANDGVHGAELWRSNGTASGTYMLIDLKPGDQNSASYASPLLFSNGTLYFDGESDTYYSYLWQSDGTEAGTSVIMKADGTKPGIGGNIASFNNEIFFNGKTNRGYELMKTDGTLPGTKLVKDIFAVSQSSNPSGFYLFDNQLFLMAQQHVHSSDTYAVDQSGNINPTADYYSEVKHGTYFNGYYYSTTYFGAAIGEELSKTDGYTPPVLVKDVNSGSPSFIGNLTVSGNQIFFSATTNSKGYELWKTDGTEIGTMLVKNINSGGGSSYPNNLADINGVLFFAANDGDHGYELWKSDGTETGTVMVKDINPSGTFGQVSDLINVNGTCFFTADDGVNGREWWRSDGTEQGTYMIADIMPGSGSGADQFGYYIPYNGYLFFAGTDASGMELWKTDGTEQGTMMVRDIRPGTNSSEPQQFFVFNNKVFFVATDGPHGRELWKTDGTEQGTKLIYDINPGNNGSNVSNLCELDGTLFFNARTNEFGKELWQTDGSTNGTFMVEDLYAGFIDSDPHELIAFNGGIYFSAADFKHGRELFRYNPVLRLEEITAEETSSDSTMLTVYPNPFTESANIQFTLSNSTEVQIELLDLQARKIKTIAEGNYEAGIRQLIFSAEDLPKGIYLLQLSTGTASEKTESVIAIKKIILD